MFGLFSLDGAPLDARDSQTVLGALADKVVATSGALVAALDASGAAIHVHEDSRSDGAPGTGNIAILLGDLDEAMAVAARLTMPANSNRAALAAAALDRWGRNAPRQLAGEWLLLRWHASSRTLILLSSETLYENCQVATDGRRLAIAPNLACLAALPWVGGDFDPDILMRTMGRSHLREAIGARTILKGVMRLRAGACITVSSHGLHLAAPDPSAIPALAAITFDDAIAELDALLRSNMRQRLSRVGGVAVQMSGGLDSSLLGLLAAEERRSDQRLVFLTSAAPEDSGVEDESMWADLVARHLGVPMVKVRPALDADVYRPSARALAATETPAHSLRHYLYEALADAALATDSQSLVDGMYGEMTISNHGHCLGSAPVRSPRMILRSWRKWWINRSISTRGDDYHVMPSRTAFASVAALHAEPTPHPRHPAIRRLSPDEPFGFEYGTNKASQISTSIGQPAVRTLFPFRDPRLIRLMSSFPAGFVRHGGIDRAPARALMHGHLPEAVVTRPKGTAFSPTYHLMLRAQADAAIARLPDQEQAGAGEWLDLAWLKVMLASVRDGARFNTQTLVRIQGSAYAAEFFRWWARVVR
uniref:asparagine synthase-related protein n=1 Tax=Sphingomonas bacterium TaxID=1895847 RepID=UPI00261D0D8B|nr:asparagine synthase-related protein [Sphingomonas bacterium]